MFYLIMKLHILFIPLLLIGCSSSNYMGENLSLKEVIQDEVSGWHREGNVEKYDRETIFRYMNGAGEIYRMYDYRGMEVLRMVKVEQPEIKIEMFDMGSPDDAFGVFSHMREGDEAGVGEGSEYRKGLLCFWQGKYFFCIIAEEETDQTKQIIFELANIITGFYKASNTKPAILNILPEENLDKNSIRYFNLPSSLNYHYFVSDKNIFYLNKETDAVLARYGSSYCYLLCIEYPSAIRSKNAFKNFLEAYLPEADTGQTIYFQMISESKWIYAQYLSEYVAIVFDAPTYKFADDLLVQLELNLASLK